MADRVRRPEKDHAKQIHAIAQLFKEHPEYQSGEKRVKLVMMGGARDQADEQRLESLKRLATELGVQASLPLVPLMTMADSGRPTWSLWSMRRTRRS